MGGGAGIRVGQGVYLDNNELRVVRDRKGRKRLRRFGSGIPNTGDESGVGARQEDFGQT